MCNDNPGMPVAPRHIPDEVLAQENSAAYLSAIPTSLQREEDDIARFVLTENSSPRAKLRKIYRIADEMLRHADVHVACHDGCASCCKMNVQITEVEASAIERATGRVARKLASSTLHENGEFNGVSCPFLRDERCSIYEHRPLSCRIHVSFYENAYWCQPERNLLHKGPMVKFSGLAEAISRVGSRHPILMGDIRDFFV